MLRNTNEESIKPSQFCLKESKHRFIAFHQRSKCIHITPPLIILRGVLQTKIVMFVTPEFITFQPSAMSSFDAEISQVVWDAKLPIKIVPSPDEADVQGKWKSLDPIFVCT